jgi:soluble lytic murein transglycosylase-like protein
MSGRRAGGAATPAAGAATPAAGAGESGQATVLLVGLLALVLLSALVLGGIANGVGAQGQQQRAADLGALAGARAMADGYGRLFEPARVRGEANAAHIEPDGYLGRARAVAIRVARANGARDVDVRIPSAPAGLAPTRIVVTVRDPVTVGDADLAAGARAEAELELAGPLGSGGDAPVNTGEYPGPFAYRGGRPMRPDTALAFDRMAAAARKAGVQLIVVSGFRTDAEQAALFAAHPDPKWVAPPGQSLHRLGTELDLGPASAYPWLNAHAGRYGFVKRYSWEPWHFGLNRNAASSKLGYGGRYSADRRTSLPAFVPARYTKPIAKAAQRWNVSATLLAAQIYQESGFNPFARSGAGAMGIAQFMPATAASYGLRNPLDAESSIDAQGHLMHDLLRRFGSVPLALAAYNAGPLPVQRCGCVPPIAETQAYVAAILALMRGAGDPAGAALEGLDVRLVR